MKEVKHMFPAIQAICAGHVHPPLKGMLHFCHLTKEMTITYCTCHCCAGGGASQHAAGAGGKAGAGGNAGRSQAHRAVGGTGPLRPRLPSRAVGGGVFASKSYILNVFAEHFDKIVVVRPTGIAYVSAIQQLMSSRGSSMACMTAKAMSRQTQRDNVIPFLIVKHFWQEWRTCAHESGISQQ